MSCGNAHYIDVGKTASSFVVHQMKLMGLELKGSRHSPCSNIEKNHVYFCTMRNPYKWWMSHLNYSIKTNGQIYKHVKRNKFPQNKNSQQLNLYEYVKGINVDRWNMPKSNHGVSLNEAWENMPNDLGLLTCHYIAWLDTKFLKQKRTTEEVISWYDRHWFKQNQNMVPLNTDNLEKELANFVETHITFFGNNDGKWKERKEYIKYNKEKIVNVKEHKIETKSYTELYDNLGENKNETLDIIKHYERLIINHFNYTLS